MSKTKIPILPLLILIAVAVLGYGGYRLKTSSEISARASEESKLEETERKECEQHLAVFFKALTQYKTDHKGGMPHSMQELIPKYIPDPSVLMCPTAVRLDKSKIRLDRATIEYDRKNYDITYGFRCMSAGFPRLVQKQGDKVVLVICKCHQQGVYTMAYQKKFQERAFDDDERAKLIPEVANAPLLGVRLSGKVETLDSATER